MKKLFVLTLALSSTILGFSQTESRKPDHKFRFGFNIGTSYSNLQSKETFPVYAKISNGVGLGLGVFMDYSISKSIFISPIFELSYNSCSVEFNKDIDYATTTYKILPFSLDLMTHIHYKMNNRKMKPYLYTGPNFKIPLTGKQKSKTDIKTNPDFAIDFGIGFENKMRYFIFAPELRYSLGLLNINQHPILPDLYFNKISLILNFK